MIGSAMGTYEPIDGNPDVDADAGYANSNPPIPGPGSQEVAQPAYSEQPVSQGAPGTLAPFMAPHGPLSTHGNALLYGLAGAAIAAATSSGRAGAKTYVFGALGGLVACWVAQKKTQGFACSMAGAVGGYAAARWLGR